MGLNGLQAVIFDMDGVLVDSEPIHKVVEAKMFKDLGFSLSHEEHHFYTGTTQKFFWEDLKKKQNLSESLEELEAANERKYLEYIGESGNLMPMSGVVDFLEELKGSDFRVAIATSASREVMNIVLKAFNLGQYFEVRVCANDVVNGKPDPEIFLKAAAGLGVDPGRCVVFEDAVQGVKAAKSAGMKAVGYTCFGKNSQDLSRADKVIDDFATVSVEWLKGM